MAISVNNQYDNHSNRARRRHPSIGSWILRRLGEIPGLEVAVGHGRQTRLTLRVASGPRAVFDLHEERLVSQERARTVAESAARSNRPTLVATSRLTTQSRVLLRTAGVSWIERDTGQCRISGPGVLVELTLGRDRSPGDGGAQKPAKEVPPALLRDKSGLLAESLLIRPHYAPIALGEIATAAGLSRSLASRLLARLTSLGILEAQGGGPRKRWTLRDPGALLDRWAEEERAEPEEATGITAWSRTTGELIERIASLDDLDYALGGVGAANLYAPTLTAAPLLELWIPAEVPPTSVANQLNGEVVATGANVRLLQRSGDRALHHAHLLPSTKQVARGPRVVSPYRAYVEARRSVGRGREVAEALRRTLPLTPAKLGGESGG
jgi:hypothetical protein